MKKLFFTLTVFVGLSSFAGIINPNTNPIATWESTENTNEIHIQLTFSTVEEFTNFDIESFANYIASLEENYCTIGVEVGIPPLVLVGSVTGPCDQIMAQVINLANQL